MKKSIALMIVAAAVLAMGVPASSADKVAKKSFVKLARKSSVKKSRKRIGPVLNRKMKSLSGKTIDLGKYRGRVVLIVNTASKCGLTPQYKDLQSIHEKYSEEGLAVLGFPCNQFGKQEPGTATEISQFCTINYGVTFDMFAKIDVNGEKRDGLYKLLTAHESKPAPHGDINWNFEKFLIGRNGKIVARFSPRTKPLSKEVVETIETELEK